MITRHTDIDPAIRDEVDTRVAAIEAEEGVRILFAIESGSRAWGFPSPDSDYDVRFVYAHPQDWYLSLEPGRDVIERPIDGVWDFAGWDIRKSLNLLLKPNPVLLEWLSSPIRYRWADVECDALLALAGKVTYGTACLYHYHHLARGQWNKYVHGRDQVSLKKYLYVIRPVMALRWLRMQPQFPPPMNFFELCDGVDLPAPLTEELDRIIVLKAQTRELGQGPRLPILDDFVAQELDWAANALPDAGRQDPTLRTEAESVFRALIRNVG